LAVVAALSAMPLSAASFGAGGANSPHVVLVRGGGGGGFSGGGFSGMHGAGGFAGGGFARMPMGGSGHSGNSAAASTPNGTSRFSPRVTGGGSRTHMKTTTTTPMTTRPTHFPFVPLLFGGYGYGYPYFDYGGGNANDAVGNNGDDSLPPVNPPQAVDPGPPIPAAANAAPPNAAGPATIADDDADGSTSAEYFTQAESAFQEGRYHDALRLASHAAVESPWSPKTHELMSLSLFALADYRGAASEAHAGIALGPIADWATVFGYYGDQTTYTDQLRALEKYSRENPTSAEARFLRAYHYLMTGHVESARLQLADAVKLTPNDKLAADLLNKYSGDAAAPLPAPPSAAPATTQDSPATFPSENRANLYAAQAYFKRVTDYVSHLRSNSYAAATFGAIAIWYESYARKIDQLPVVGVDPELVAYSQRTANSMRRASSLIKGANNQKGLGQANVQPQYVTDTWGVTYRDYSAENDAKRTIRSEETSNAGTFSRQIMQQIEQDTASTRQRMSLKYNDNF